MIEIESIDLSRLNNGGHFLYVSDFVNKASRNQQITSKMGKAFGDLQNVINKEDECLKSTKKSFFSDEIAEADSKRDSLFLAYKKTIKGFMEMPIETMANAAKVLNQHIKDYNIDVKAQLDKETGLLINFIDDLQRKYSNEVKTLSLQGYVDALREANDTVHQATLNRKDETAERLSISLREARKITDEAYYTLVKHINAFAIVEGEQNYKDFIDYANLDIKHYKENVMPRKKSKTDDTAAAQE